MTLKVYDSHYKYLMSQTQCDPAKSFGIAVEQSPSPVSAFEKDNCEKKNLLKSPLSKKLWFVAGFLPPVRRVESAPQRIEDGDIDGAVVLTAMMLANLPKDTTQMGLAFRDFKEVLTKGINNVSKKEDFRVCSFFRGTFLEKIMKPLLNKYQWLKKLDGPILETKFGDAVMKFFKIEIDKMGNTAGVSKDAAKIDTYIFAGNKLQKIVGGSLVRLSVLGFITIVIIEAPAVIKSVIKTESTLKDKMKALGKQLIKSAGYIGIVSAGIALGGAAMARTRFGAAAELAGMAVGSAAGLMACNAINKKVDSVI